MQVTTPTKDTNQPGHTNQGYKVQGMQVTTSNQGHQPHEPGTRGSRHAGNHTNQDTNQGHTNQGHEVQGMQVINKT